jgi:RNA polymerase sigma factor (TIGR02999 family)
MGEDVTELLQEWNQGNRAALDRLMPLVTSELRKVARAYLRRERADHTLQPTALVNEAYLRMVNWDRVSWRDRAHFFAAAARVMRRILVDHARAHRAAKRGGCRIVSLANAAEPADDRDVDVVALDQALDELAALDERQARLVELRFFAGLTIEETAEVLKIGAATVSRDWATARAWLYRRLQTE